MNQKIILIVSVTWAVLVQASCAHKYLTKNVTDVAPYTGKPFEIVTSAGEVWQARLLKIHKDTLLVERYVVRWQNNTYVPVVLDTISVSRKEIRRLDLIALVPPSESFRRWYSGLVSASALALAVIIGLAAAALSNLE